MSRDVVVNEKESWNWKEEVSKSPSTVATELELDLQGDNETADAVGQINRVRHEKRSRQLEGDLVHLPLFVLKMHLNTLKVDS